MSKNRKVSLTNEENLEEGKEEEVDEVSLGEIRKEKKKRKSCE